MLPNIGLGELTVIVLVALLVFGPKRLPEMMRAAGRALGKFQRESQSAIAELRNATNFTGDLGAPPNLGAFDAPDAALTEVAPVAPDPGGPIPAAAEPGPGAVNQPGSPGAARKAPAKKKGATAKPGASKPRTAKPRAGKPGAATRPKRVAPAISEPFEDT